MPTLSRRSLLASLCVGGGAALLGGSRALAMGVPARRFVIVLEGNSIEPGCFMSANTVTDVDAQATSSIVGRRWSYNLYGHTSPIEVAAGDMGTATALDPLLSDGSTTDLTAKSAVLLGLSKIGRAHV